MRKKIALVQYLPDTEACFSIEQRNVYQPALKRKGRERIKANKSLLSIFTPQLLSLKLEPKYFIFKNCILLDPAKPILAKMFLTDQK